MAELHLTWMGDGMRRQGGPEAFTEIECKCCRQQSNSKNKQMGWVGIVTNRLVVPLPISAACSTWAPPIVLPRVSMQCPQACVGGEKLREAVV